MASKFVANDHAVGLDLCQSFWEAQAQESGRSGGNGA